MTEPMKEPEEIAEEKFYTIYFRNSDPEDSEDTAILYAISSAIRTERTRYEELLPYKDFVEKYRNHKPRHPDDERSWIPVLFDLEKKYSTLKAVADRMAEALKPFSIWRDKFYFKNGHEGLEVLCDGAKQALTEYKEVVK